MAAPLQPPSINTQDGGVPDLSESDDHFSSASEGELAATPITRVERVDDRPAYGEVPGTAAYAVRTQDAVPDEIEVVPDGQRSRSTTQSRSRAASARSSASSRPQTPGGTPIPRTVVERIDDRPTYGEVEGTLAKEMRQADAVPDEVRPASREARSGLIDEGRQDSSTVDDEQRQAWFHSMWEGRASGGHEDAAAPRADADGADHDDGAGDDFDEFNEGDGDDDFGDFDEAEAPASPAEDGRHAGGASASAPSTDGARTVLSGLPPLNLAGLTKEQTQDAIAPYINAIFPNSEPLTPLKDIPPIDASHASPFLSDRSLALWQQLASPPPMQPPNWTRSRIRRLFLVSLGVPVDLDEILPPSKQKRLVLPNIHLAAGSPRPSSAIERLKEHGANDSSTSVDSKTGQSKRSAKRAPKGPPPPPDFDLNAAALLCGTTEQAMSVYSDAELKDHVFTLEVLNRNASSVLEYWLQRKDESVKEKETLEGFIENLVGFVKGRRGK